MPLYVLLIEADPGDTRVIKDLLSRIPKIAAKPKFRLRQAEGLEQGLKLLRSRRVDVVLMDLYMPGFQGFTSLDKVQHDHPEIPIVVLTDLDDEDTAVAAVEKGAQDYLTKGDLTGKLLARSLRYAVERHRLQRELARMSVVDELTGLYNRRGFFTLGLKEYQRAKRRKLEFLIIFADLDGLKKINDTFGHDVGDQYLRDAAGFLKESFRSSDFLARIGGDEFAIIAYETGRVSSDGIRRRIDGQLAR